MLEIRIFDRGLILFFGYITKDVNTDSWRVVLSNQQNERFMHIAFEQVFEGPFPACGQGPCTLARMTTMHVIPHVAF
jgi:hypothetical protein